MYRGRGPQACHKLQLCYKLRVVPSFLLQRARLSCFASSCLAGVTNASQTSSLGSWLIYQGGVVHASEHTHILFHLRRESTRTKVHTMQTWADASEHNFLLCGALVDALALRRNGVSGQGSRQSTHRMVLNSRTRAAILECAFCITSPPLSS